MTEKKSNILCLSSQQNWFFIFHEIPTSKMYVVVSLSILHMMIRSRLESDLFLMEHRNSQHLSSFDGIGFTFGNGLYRAIWAITAVSSFAHLIGRNMRIIFQLLSIVPLEKTGMRIIEYMQSWYVNHNMKKIIQSC